MSIGRIGALAQNESIIKETVAFFSVLVDSDEDELFLSSRRFARALMTFVDRTSGSANLFVGEETEGEIVEMLFGIASKIRLEPSLLTVWFSTSTGLGPRASLDGGSGLPTKDRKNKFVGVTSKDDFPLCYQLIDHVHHGGRVGDFARTGLLYVFETASKSQELEHWIIESDLPTLMASGLGALYSQLSRKLSILHPKTDLPVILQLSDYTNLDSPQEAESLFSSYTQGHLETFLSYLTFWQDILEHCTSAEVKQTLLDHFQVLFLQQLLYPSLLESSDVDGGSSVAVLTYLQRILMSIDHPEFVHLILQYLLALPGSVGMEASVISLTSYAANKRKSLLLLTKTADGEEASPELFNLADLVQSSIRSINVETVIAAFKLMTVLLQKNHPYAVETIIKVDAPLQEASQRTHGALNAELTAYLSIAEKIGGNAGLDEAYAALLKDAQRHVELHCCSAPLLTLGSLGIPSTAHRLVASTLDETKDLAVHVLQFGDHFFAQITKLLENFFTNNIELNLSLTETVLNLASCPQMRLEGWLAVNPSHYRFPPAESLTHANESHSDVQRMQRARHEPQWAPSHAPILLQTFSSLENQIEMLMIKIPSFGQLISTRKQAFRLHDEISDALLATPQQVRTTPSQPPSSPTPSRPSAGSTLNRLLSGPDLQTARSASPRGRTSMRPDLPPAQLSSPSPNYRVASSITSPARGSPSLRPVEDVRSVVVGQGPEDLLSDIIEGANSELLGTKVEFPLRLPTETSVKEAAVESRITTVSLSHVLTNVVVLQEFILELSAVMQVRASLFGEVVFA